MTSLQWGSCSNVQVGDPLFTKVTSATGFMNARISQTKTTAKMVFCCNHDNLQGMPSSLHFYLPYYLSVFFLGLGGDFSRIFPHTLIGFCNCPRLTAASFHLRDA